MTIITAQTVAGTKRQIVQSDAAINRPIKRAAKVFRVTSVF